MARVIYAEDRASGRTFDEEGRLDVAVVNISKACVNGYLGQEIPNWRNLGLQADRMYQLLRDPEELAKAAETFRNVPLLALHQAHSAALHDGDAIAGTVGSDVAFRDPYLQASIKVWTEDDIEGVMTGEVKQLSSSYRYEADMTPGNFRGVPYDGVMRNIRGNHVALVPVGRAGPDVVVADEALNLERRMARKLSQGARDALKKKIEAKKGLLASDGSIGEMLDAVVEAVEENMPEPKEAEANDKRGKDADPDDETPEERKERLERRAAAKDKRGRDEEPKELREGKEAKDGRGKDEKTDEQKEKDKMGNDSVSRIAMDAALDRTKRETRAEVMGEMRAIQEARSACFPHMGEMAVAFDSADEVYRTTLEANGVKTKDVHPSAFPHMVAMLGKAGRASAPSMASDAAPPPGMSARKFDTSRFKH